MTTIRDHLQREHCARHRSGLADLEKRLGRRSNWCPDCGTKIA